MLNERTGSGLPLLIGVFAAGCLTGWIVTRSQPRHDTDVTAASLPSHPAPPIAGPVESAFTGHGTTDATTSFPSTSTHKPATNDGPLAMQRTDPVVYPSADPSADALDDRLLHRNEQDTSGDAVPLSQESGSDPLRRAQRISCQFTEGTTISWTGGEPVQVGSSWQGGALLFDALDFDAGTAIMSGTQGATGSVSGSVGVRVAITPTGVHFSSFLPRGDLATISVSRVTDVAGLYAAVISSHGTQRGDASSQFYGRCAVM